MAPRYVSRRLFPFAMLTAVVFSPQPADLQADWPAKQFQVQTREPVTLEEAEMQQEIDAGTGTFESLWQAVAGPEGSEWQAAASQAEQWMNEIGDLYRNGGHEAPYIQPIVHDNGVAKYRVYMFPFTGSRSRSSLAYAGGGYQLSDCVGSSEMNWVSYNADFIPPIPPGGDLPKEKFETFAHETFHALQYGDQLMANCFVGNKWITEGMADGAGLYLTNRKWPNYSGNLDGSSSATGLRHYDWPLNFSTGRRSVSAHSLENKTSYLTSSFWQFFAETFGGVKVFPHFLDEALAKDASGDDLLEWLDQRLRTEPNIQSGLYLAYPHFVTEFASYGGSRYTRFASRSFGTGKAARTAWLNEAFTGCRQVTLTPDSPAQELKISLMKVAAMCIKVRLEGFEGNVTERIEILSERLDILDQLHLGWAWIDGPDGLRNCYQERKSLKTRWPPCIIKPYSQTGPASGIYARTWASDTLDFRMSAGEAEKIYILSNVAELPWKTREVDRYTLKIGITNATLNDEPAEPVEQLPIARKSSAPKPPGPVGKEELYGLITDPPIPEDTVTGLGLNRYAPNRAKGGKPQTSGGYEIQFVDLRYGHTGPVRGIVALQASDPRNRQGPVSSLFCQGAADRPIGTVAQSDATALRITIDTDVCQAGPGMADHCGQGDCPVIEHVNAAVTVAFGWRQFNSTAPTDIRTPGIQRYIDTMPDSLHEAMRFGADTAVADTTGSPANGGDTSDTAAGSGASSGSGGLPEPCACSCEELAATDQAAMDLKARIAAGEEPSMEAIAAFTRCADACQREYMICRTDQAAVEKEAKQVERDGRRGTTETCDCSCEQMTATHDRARELQQRQSAGATIPIEDLVDLTRCAEVCQQEHMACLLQGNRG
jgi:hypothetical protein